MQERHRDGGEAREDQMESKEGRSLWEVWRRVCMIDERGGGLFRGSRCHHPVSRDRAKIPPSQRQFGRHK